MSQMTSTARVGARALNRPPAPTTPRLRVVTGAPPRRSGAAFGIFCATLLVAGLIGLLLLNTALAQGSFTLQKLQATSDQLADTQNGVSQSLDAMKSPASLASRAADMGMVPAQSAAFLRLSDGRVLGVAKPALRTPGFAVVHTTQPSPPATVTAQKPGGLAPAAGSSGSTMKPGGSAPAPAAAGSTRPAPDGAAAKQATSPRR